MSTPTHTPSSGRFDVPNPSSEFTLLIEMLERISAALHIEAQPPPHRYSRHNVGAAAGNIESVAKNLRRLCELTQGETQ